MYKQNFKEIMFTEKHLFNIIPSNISNSRESEFNMDTLVQKDDKSAGEANASSVLRRTLFILNAPID